MTHQEAIDAQAPERYLLDELPDGARDEFESHYFDCQTCAEDVRSGFTFIETLRAEGRRTRPFRKAQEARKRRFAARFAAPLAAAASLIVGIAGTYAGFVRPALTQLAEARRPGTPASYVVSQTRAESSAAVIANRHEPFEFDVEIDVGDEVPTYSWSILNAAGNVRYGPFHAGADRVRDLRLPIVIPANALDSGEYTLRVLSKRALNIPFTVR